MNVAGTRACAWIWQVSVALARQVVARAGDGDQRGVARNDLGGCAR